MDKLQHYLNQFKDGKLVIRVDSAIAYNVLTEILYKYDISLIADSEFPDHLYERPYVVVDEDTYVHSYEDMDNVSRFTDIHDSIELSELEYLDKADLLQDFKDGKLMVHVSNDTQYEKLISYLSPRDNRINYNTLSAIGFDSSNRYCRMVGGKFMTYRNYDIDNTVSFFDFVPRVFQIETDRNDLAAFTSGRLIIHINNSMEHRLFLDYLKEHGLSDKLYPDIKQYNKDNAYFYMYKGKMSGDMLLTAVRDVNTSYFREHHKEMSVKEFCNVDFANNTKIQEMKAEPEETVPLSVYEQVMAERNQAFAQLNALGISFGEDPKFSLDRIREQIRTELEKADKEDEYER